LDRILDFLAADDKYPRRVTGRAAALSRIIKKHCDLMKIRSPILASVNVPLNQIPNNYRGNRAAQHGGAQHGRGPADGKPILAWKPPPNAGTSR
jgi:hypothetical protein